MGVRKALYGFQGMMIFLKRLRLKLYVQDLDTGLESP